MLKVLPLAMLLILMGCQNRLALKGKTFFKKTQKGSIYLVFGTNGFYRQYLIDNNNIDSAIGKYSEGKYLTLYDFVIYDKELQDILNSGLNKPLNIKNYPIVGSLQIYALKKDCFYFDLDITEYNFCKIDELPFEVKEKIFHP